MAATGKSLLPQTRVQVNLDALARNVSALKRKCGSAELMAVVKADAYGHGAVRSAEAALANGASRLAVARISEAVELREAGVDAPILLFGDILPEQAEYAAQNRIAVTLANVETAESVSGHLAGKGLCAAVHIKVDTGMGRLGFTALDHPERTAAQIVAFQKLKGLKIEGVYTHLANADAADKTHANKQLDRFDRLKNSLEQQGLSQVIFHAANSAAVIEIPRAHYDMVRPGVALYGLWPSSEVDKSLIDLAPAMSIRSVIIHLKQVPKGFKVSYGSTHVTKKATTVATIPIGYADGYSRGLSSKGTMVVKGMIAPVIGRVCMDFTMIDVGHTGAGLGDEVVIMGTQATKTVCADELAELTGTINYEVTSGLTKRMPIDYVND